jgi:hypothetical protein
MMDYFGLIDWGIVVVAVFGFGFWQLWSLRKPKADDEAKSGDDL